MNKKLFLFIKTFAADAAQCIACVIDFCADLLFDRADVEIGRDIINVAAPFTEKMRMRVRMSVVTFLAVHSGADLQDFAGLAEQGKVSVYGSEAELGVFLLQVRVNHVGGRVIITRTEIA